MRLEYFCMRNSIYISREINIGGLLIGNNKPIRVQSMTNTSTQDIQATIEQTLRIIQAGGELVRISVKNETDLRALEVIANKLKKQNCHTPLIADIHFSAKLAEQASSIVQKVRINPGNYYSHKNAISYHDYLQQIKQNITPLVESCKKYSCSLRIGTNHGSLSPRIKELYGTGSNAMTEATMEFVRILSELNMHDIVLSIKASNATTNIKATQQLVETLDKEGYNYPLHLGVTEAGLGFSGRIKSAVGIGALLADGIGDTIRVSLTEAPEHEIPTAIQITSLFNPTKSQLEFRKKLKTNNIKTNDKSPFTIIGKKNIKYLVGLEPDVFAEDLNYDNFYIIETQGSNSLYDFTEKYLISSKNFKTRKLLWKRIISQSENNWQLRFAAELGSLIAGNLINACMLDGDEMLLAEAYKILFEVLQVCDTRKTHADFVSCPSCNRTSFDIIDFAEKVRTHTYHLKDISIAVMGCIVNGPGEMGDVIYGFVGQQKDYLSLFHKGEMIIKNIHIDEALDVLVEVMKQNGDWIDR